MCVFIVPNTVNGPSHSLSAGIKEQGNTQVRHDVCL